MRNKGERTGSGKVNTSSEARRGTGYSGGGSHLSAGKAWTDMLDSEQLRPQSKRGAFASSVGKEQMWDVSWRSGLALG